MVGWGQKASFLCLFFLGWGTGGGVAGGVGVYVRLLCVRGWVLLGFSFEIENMLGWNVDGWVCVRGF